MTSRDVRDILSLPSRQTGSATGPAPAKKRPKARAPRADGITRELYALMGDNAPPLALAALRRPGLKEQLKESGKREAAKWKTTGFTNEARGDGFRLKHWVREPDEPESSQQPYKFAKYNSTSNPVSYSQEEYLHHLRDDDWTRDETDYLFHLLSLYDLRFPVVADRYDFPGASRTVESLKARYYSICQKLISARPSTGTEEEKAKEISSYNFDPSREADRKAHVASLVWRTPAQIAEEDFLYIESRRLEQTAQRFSQERDALMSTIDGMLYQLVKSSVDLSSNSALPSGSTSSAAAAAARKARRSDPYDGADLVAPPGGGQKVSKALLAQDTLNCVHRFDGPTPINQPPVTLRSTRVALPKPVLAPRITAALEELGMPTAGKQLVMPTRANVARYEELLNATAAMVELKRQAERIEAEIEVQKRKKVALGGGTGHAPATATTTESETLRASVEPRTARSTSAVKRSPSVSSVASSARERKRARKA